MIPLGWDELEALGLGDLRGRPVDGVVRRVHDDSREARPGDLFVALTTGVGFVSDALAPALPADGPKQGQPAEVQDQPHHAP